MPSVSRWRRSSVLLPKCPPQGCCIRCRSSSAGNQLTPEVNHIQQQYYTCTISLYIVRPSMEKLKKKTLWRLFLYVGGRNLLIGVFFSVWGALTLIFWGEEGLPAPPPPRKVLHHYNHKVFSKMMFTLHLHCLMFQYFFYIMHLHA